MIRWFLFLTFGLLVLVGGMVSLIIALIAPWNPPLLALGCLVVFIAIKILEKSYQHHVKSAIHRQKWPETKRSLSTPR